EDHPIGFFLKYRSPKTGKSLRFTINTDDSGLFATDMQREVHEIARAFHLSPETVLEIVQNGFSSRLEDPDLSPPLRYQKRLEDEFAKASARASDASLDAESDVDDMIRAAAESGKGRVVYGNLGLTPWHMGRAQEMIKIGRTVRSIGNDERMHFFGDREGIPVNELISSVNIVIIDSSVKTVKFRSHAGIRYNTIYIHEDILETFSEQDLAGLIREGIIELAGRKMARETGIDWSLVRNEVEQEIERWQVSRIETHPLYGEIYARIKKEIEETDETVIVNSLIEGRTGGLITALGGDLMKSLPPQVRDEIAGRMENLLQERYRERLLLESGTDIGTLASTAGRLAGFLWEWNDGPFWIVRDFLLDNRRDAIAEGDVLRDEWIDEFVKQIRENKRAGAALSETDRKIEGYRQ
ncbi:MAG TPA: hypothetical protein VJC03_01940, partial [bacterium]|nr:hypothetical protein [bacterium]